MNVSRISINPVIFGVIFLLFISAITQAATYVVIDGQTIGSALEVCSVGDTVLVGPGDYYESGLQMSSGVVLAALYPDLPEQPRLIGSLGATIIHCENLLSTTRIEGLSFLGDFSTTQRVPIRGHGLQVINSALSIQDCSFQNLKASYGGAIFIGSGDSPKITGCTFESNSALASGGAVALVGGQDLLLDHCLFQGNTAVAGGSVLNAALQGSAQVSNCTMVGNGLAGMGDIQSWDSGLVEVSGCIVTSGSGRPCYGDYSSTPQFHCSDLTANAGGDWVGALAGMAEVDGNISLDPLFCGDLLGGNPFTIEDGSPCAAENNPGCGFMGAFEIGCTGSAGSGEIIEEPVEENTLPVVTRLRGNYPNPFNPQTTIAFELSHSGRAVVDVYDLAGRLVRNLHSGVLDAGTHEVLWNGRDSDGGMSATGIYFFRLKTDSVIDTGRMILVK